MLPERPPMRATTALDRWISRLLPNRVQNPKSKPRIRCRNSGGKRRPNVQPSSNNRPAAAPMKAPSRKPHRTLKRKAKKAPSSVNERAWRRKQGSSAPPSTEPPCHGERCMVAGPQWSQRSQSLTTRTSSRMLEFTQGAAPSDLSYAICSTRSRHTFFISPEGLERHVWGTLSRPGTSCSLVTSRQCQPMHQAPALERSVLRGPSPLPAVMPRTSGCR